MRIQTQKMTKWTKSFLGDMIFDLRLHHLLLSNAGVVVAFHRVNNRTLGDGLTCSVEMFKRYCRFFATYLHVVSLGELITKIETGAPLRNELAITFDDGYQDNFEYAAPLLKGMGLPATFFVVTRFIETGIVPWWDSNLNVRHSWMTWDHVRQLHEEGFDIGAHTRTHADLGQVREDMAREEIMGSRIDLEERLGEPVRFFAYPYGKAIHITEQARDMVRKAGFRCCCSCFGGINTGETNPFHLRRIPIGSWHETTYHFAFDLAFRRV